MKIPTQTQMQSKLSVLLLRCYVKKTLNCSSSKHSGRHCQQFSPDGKSKHTSAPRMFPPAHIHVNWSSNDWRIQERVSCFNAKRLKTEGRVVTSLNLSLGQSVVGDDGETLKPNTSMKDDFWWWNASRKWKNTPERRFTSITTVWPQRKTRWRNIEPSWFQYDVWLQSFHIYINMLFQTCRYEIYFKRL